MSYRDGWWDPRSESQAFHDRERRRWVREQRRIRRARFEPVVLDTDEEDPSPTSTDTTEGRSG